MSEYTANQAMRVHNIGPAIVGRTFHTPAPRRAIRNHAHGLTFGTLLVALFSVLVGF